MPPRDNCLKKKNKPLLRQHKHRRFKKGGGWLTRSWTRLVKLADHKLSIYKNTVWLEEYKRTLKVALGSLFSTELHHLRINSTALKARTWDFKHNLQTSTSSCSPGIYKKCRHYYTNKHKQHIFDRFSRSVAHMNMESAAVALTTLESCHCCSHEDVSKPARDGARYKHKGGATQ